MLNFLTEAALCFILISCRKDRKMALIQMATVEEACHGLMVSVFVKNILCGFLFFGIDFSINYELILFRSFHRMDDFVGIIVQDCSRVS